MHHDPQDQYADGPSINELIATAALTEACRLIAALGGSQSAKAWEDRLKRVGLKVAAGSPGLSEKELGALAAAVAGARTVETTAGIAVVEKSAKPKADQKAIAINPEITINPEKSTVQPAMEAAPPIAWTKNASPVDLTAPLVGLGDLLPYANPGDDQLVIAAVATVPRDGTMAAVRYAVGMTPADGVLIYDLLIITEPGAEPVTIADGLAISGIGAPNFGTNYLVTNAGLPAGSLIVLRLREVPDGFVDLTIIPVGYFS